MTQPDREAVLRALAEWIWIPPGARQVETPEYLLVEYPEHFVSNTLVLWTRATRPVPDLIAEAAEHARRWGRTYIDWFAGLGSEPDDLAEQLAALGYSRTETLDVLAAPVAESLARLDPPADVVVRAVEDETGVRALALIDHEAFGNAAATEERIAEAVRRRREHPEPHTVTLVAYVDGEPAAQGGLTMAESVARLWGGATRPKFERRGLYRAVLAGRLAEAQRRGATLALVTGRIETSGPILRRAGFTAYGQQYTYRVPV